MMFQSMLRCCLGVILLTSLTALGQQPLETTDETPLPNIGHTRHHHPRIPKMPGTPDPARFTTSRPKALQLPLPDEKDAFTFVIFGDRTGGPADGVRVLADAVRDVNLLAPDLVMTVGDLIQGYNAQDAWMEQMREYKTIMDKLVCPWFPVAGNHDVYWRGPADQKPAGEHEKNYEMHFGPLWYAFKHKRCVFIALYSDEGNPETGEKTFHKPESQRMSAEQFEWLKKTLADNSDAEHIFLFLHHPRWLGSNTDGHGGYGDDWNRVHAELKAAGNVTAVFAGHIHHMRYDPKDGIEYVTLATTGGGQSGLVPHVGFLHHYHVVTVRKDQVAMAAFPVGQAMDVREITGELVRHVTNLANSRLPMTGDLKLRSDGSLNGTFKIALANPTDRDVDFTVALDSKDSRWRFWPDHEHGVVKPGETREFELGLRRLAGSFDESFRPARVLIDAEYLAPSFRYQVPQRAVDVRLNLDEVMPPVPAREMALKLDGKQDVIAVASEQLGIGSDPFTMECWFKADSFNERVGLMSKMQSSDYGIFVSNGRPSFGVHGATAYTTVRGPAGSLEVGRWYHIAGSFDGQRVRLYVDGKLIASATIEGARKTNRLDLMIGGDVDGQNRLDSPFHGMIDAVRISQGARYTTDTIEVKRRLENDEQTILLFNFDGKVGPWIVDESKQKRQFTPQGNPAIVPAD